ncbi:hypothetical protein [Schlesneria paludicola]|uniref:hypothetical protein n=1 Tax=Schlesneria paludicola TaxID=360056 RepID=UPI00029A240A|nr:hypothetical protein [Schlesneria paludicola]
MNFARQVFRYAGIYGLIVMTPQYFLEHQVGVQEPPAITHPEFFYGFLGVGIAWQVAFIIIAQSPDRYRPLMIAAMIEKFSFGIAVPILFALGRVSGTVFGFAIIDLIFAALFVEAYRRTTPKTPPASSATDS